MITGSDVYSQKFLVTEMYKFGLIGYPLGHTFSPKIFEQIFKEAGVNGVYRIFEIPTRRLFYQTCIELLTNGFHGLNVTIPYKIDAYYLAEEKEIEAVKCQNANFLYLKDGVPVAANTDYEGLRETIKNELKLHSGSAAIIGYGGAARTSAAVLDDLGINTIYFVVRDLKKAKYALQDHSGNLKAEVNIVENPASVASQLDILINASPAGMFPDVEKLPHGHELLNNVLPDGMVVDLIYNPPETKLLQLARKNSLKTKNGLYMLIVQAVKSFEKVADIKIEPATILRAIGEANEES